ncbi:MAG: spermidine/putrescine ABC transporter substrate-binding protein [Alphaproteobacteria bacterium]|nr:spermidine/putrescine ABC transporter substrate-binding protein [Alphaproteobacteria bacterium]
MRHIRIVANLVIFTTLLATVSLWGLTANAADADKSRELVILNWEEYLDPDLVAEFEEAFNAKVREVYYEQDNERDKLLLQSDGKGYDIAIIDGLSIANYQKRGWLARIDQQQIPNLQHIHPRWRSAHALASDYAVPYFWGTTGIAYRSDLIDTEITSWMELFKPPEAAMGRIAMVSDPRDLTASALLALGHSPNTGDLAELEAARNLLMAQKPHVRSYSYISMEEDSSLLAGDVTMAFMWSGDALALQEQNENITYVVPKEGSLLWVDYMAILEGSQNKDLAAAFINFMNEPKMAARQAEYVYYPTPNKAAEAFLPAEFLEDEVIYPSTAILDRSSFYGTVPASAARRYALIVAQITR